MPFRVFGLAHGMECGFAGGREPPRKDSDVNVSMWMTRDVISIAAETSITSAAALMARHRIRSLAVTAWGSAGGRLHVEYCRNQRARAGKGGVCEDTESDRLRI